MARWEATLRAGEVDEGVRREELKAVEKLEVLLKASTCSTGRTKKVMLSTAVRDSHLRLCEPCA